MAEYYFIAGHWPLFKKTNGFDYYDSSGHLQRAGTFFEGYEKWKLTKYNIGILIIDYIERKRIFRVSTRETEVNMLMVKEFLEDI